MLQRLIAAVLAVLGITAIGLGVASATVWRAEDTLVATASAAPDGTVVVTAPGVLELGGSPVTVTARANGGSKVVLAVGREADVAGWVADDAHTVITGLTDLETLTTDEVAGGDSPKPSPDADGSDLWVQQASGETTAELTWTPEAGRWTLLAAGSGEGAAAPSVVLSWPQTVTTPWLVPGVVVGTLLLLAGIALVVVIRRGRRPVRPESWQPVETGAMRAVPVPGASSAAASGGATSAQPPVSDDDAPTVLLTRRQMREAAAQAAAAPAPTRPTTAAQRTVPLLARLRRRGGESDTTSDGTQDVPAPPKRPTTRGASPRGTAPTAPGIPEANPVAIPPAAGGAHDPAAAPAPTAWRQAWGFPTTGTPDAASPPGESDQPGPDSARPGKES